MSTEMERTLNAKSHFLNEGANDLSVYERAASSLKTFETFFTLESFF